MTSTCCNCGNDEGAHPLCLDCLEALDTRTAILAALRAELPGLSCYEPSRMIGSPCSCAAGLLRAIEIVEAAQ